MSRTITSWTAITMIVIHSLGCSGEGGNNSNGTVPGSAEQSVLDASRDKDKRVALVTARAAVPKSFDWAGRTRRRT